MTNTGRDLTLEALLPQESFILTAETARKLSEKLHLTVRELLIRLIPIARKTARPPISNYYVGAAGIGRSGGIYLGFNLEFPGVPLSQTVHAEQAVISNAHRGGEEKLLEMAVSAAPCGHCRQFLNELGNGGELLVLIAGREPAPLASLLPESFGPRNLGIEGSLLGKRDNSLVFISPPLAGGAGENLQSSGGISAKLLKCGLAAVNAAYAPYTNSPSAVAISTRDGEIFTGSCLENAAYNPGLPPLQGALVALAGAGREYEQISGVVLLEKKDAPVQQEETARLLLHKIAPQASFKVQYVGIGDR
ncbi:MAG: cytidine deaminase [Armatimonadetes bacterium]|nr:cytidine deaminase [Armatimonadota bacterium]